MAGILGSIGLLSSSLASKLLLPHHHNRQIKTPLVHMRTRCTLKQQQQQQHKDNRLKKIVVVNHAHKCTLKKQQQHNDDNRLKKIVVVNHAHKESPEISLLSITDVEGINEKITISSTSGGVPIASCHGLFLTTEGRSLNIWNPSSKDDDEVIRTIPQSSVPRPPTLVYETPLMFGFGFDPSSNDYKVIRFVDFDCNDGSLYNFYLCNWVVELYSLKTQSWKQIAYPHGLAAYLADYTCVYINGFCYWKMLAPQSGRLLILPFDLANDTFPSALIPGPNGLVGFKFQLVEFEGSLAVVAFEYEPFEFELWVWNNNDESWSKRGAWAINGDDNFYIPVGRVFKNDKIFLQNSMRELVLFDFAKQKLENLGFYAVHGLPLKIYPYVESSAEDIK